MTTDTVLLIMILTGLACASPGAIALWRSKGNRLSIQAAEQLEAQLKTRLDNMHARIMTLEAESAEKDKRMDAMQAQSDQQQGKIAVLERQNSGLAAMVKRLIAQLERHEIAPEVTAHDLTRLLT
jgi:peptidoglycan hydrolase CwlO-like protein